MTQNTGDAGVLTPEDNVYLNALISAMSSTAPSVRARRREYINIDFQSGPIAEVGVNGAHIEDVIDLLIERLRGFNEGPMRCRENSLAITSLEEASNWLMLRRLNRVAQGVEGTYLSHN